jgi:hypothetical protein
MDRIPVKFQDKVLMPMKISRAKRFLVENKTKLKYDNKLKLYYIILYQEPNGYNTQDITLGIDPGSTFDGFSVVSRQCHHLNVELIQRLKQGKTSIKYFKNRQASNRRVRRNRLRHRLRHRPIRFDNRTSSKLPPTIKANNNFRKWLITKLMKYYPITKVIIEDVAFDHFLSNKGASFSMVEVGKNDLYE